MLSQKKASFSSDGRLFAYIDEDDGLLIYETASSKIINSNLAWTVNACSCIRWISKPHIQNNKKKAKLSKDILEETLLAAGNAKGDILIYNAETRNLFLHLAGRHEGAINDMCLYSKNNYFFTCSSDQHIAIWDISNGKQISKWKVEENPVSAICVIDDENLLSSSTIILWWSISKQTVLKKFSGHATEIIKLIPVKVDTMKSYVLSAAVDDTKINAWSLTSSVSEPFVASFSLPFALMDMDISKVSSKDKPLILSAVTKDGQLYIFEHALNGNMNESIKPEVSVEINKEWKDFSGLSIKLLNDSNECIIAYGSSKSSIAFKHVKIKELLEKNKEETVTSMNCETPVKLSLKDSNKSGKNLPVNGLNDSVFSNYKSKLRSSIKCSSALPDSTNSTEKAILTNPHIVNQEVDLHDPKSAVEALLEAIETQNGYIIETIFKNSDPDYRSSIVQILPTSSLKIILDEINHRLLQEYSITLCRWLKEILSVHLRYLTKCDEAVESLNQTRRHLSSLNISETLLKMTALQGLLNLQVQDSSSDESDSEDGEAMEL